MARNQTNAELREFWQRRNADDRYRYPSLSDEEIGEGLGEDSEEERYAEDEAAFCDDFPNCGGAGCSACLGAA